MEELTEIIKKRERLGIYLRRDAEHDGRRRGAIGNPDSVRNVTIGVGTLCEGAAPTGIGLIESASARATSATRRAVGNLSTRNSWAI
jgi:hypothetical protein